MIIINEIIRAMDDDAKKNNVQKHRKNKLLNKVNLVLGIWRNKLNEL